MDTSKFSAFISYRHGDRDSAVAKVVQNGIEHYKIPRSIQKKTGKKKIDRVFRDQSELSADSDLPEQIKDALDNAEYLIVICSSRTKESLWVPQEISHFLEHHDMKKVMTVLSEGEPYDVIPEQLLGEHEPISADLRKWKRGNPKGEILRLIAPILGVKYVELSRRQQQYEKRRLAVALAAVLLLSSVAIGYLTYSRNEIQKNYNNTLVNQSLYLSQSSLDVLETSGDRVLASQLSLSALPQKENDRPIISEAVYALQQSLGAYKMKNNAQEAIWTYQTTGEIQTIATDKNGKWLCTYDNQGEFILWNLKTHKKVNSKSDPFISEFAVVGDYILIVTSSEISCISIDSFEQKWNLGLMGYNLLVLEDGEHIILTPNESIARNHTDLIYCDIETGEYAIIPGLESDVLSLLEVKAVKAFVSKDGRYVATDFVIDFGNEAEKGWKHSSYITIWDLDQHTDICQDVIEGYYLGEEVGIFDESGRFFLIRKPLVGNETTSFYSYGNQASNDKRKRLAFDSWFSVCSYNLKTGEQEWNNTGYDTQREATPVGAYLSSDNNLVVTFGCNAYKYNRVNGEIKDYVELEAAVLSFWVEEKKDMIVLGNGSAGTITWHTGNEFTSIVSTEDIYPNDIRDIATYTDEEGKKGCVLQETGKPYALQYREDMYDTDFISFSDEATGSSDMYDMNNFYNDANISVVLSKMSHNVDSNTFQNTYCLRIADNNKHIFYDSEEWSCNVCRLVGVYGDETAYVYAHNNVNSSEPPKIMRIDLYKKTIASSFSIDTIYKYEKENVKLLEDGNLQIIAEYSDFDTGTQILILKIDSDGNVISSIPIDIDNVEFGFEFHFIQDSNYIFAINHDGKTDVGEYLQLQGYDSEEDMWNDFYDSMDDLIESGVMTYEEVYGDGTRPNTSNTEENAQIVKGENQEKEKPETYNGKCFLVNGDTGKATELKELPYSESEYHACGVAEDKVIIGASGVIAIYRDNGQKVFEFEVAGVEPFTAMEYGQNLLALSRNKDGESGIYRFNTQSKEMVDYIQVASDLTSYGFYNRYRWIKDEDTVMLQYGDQLFVMDTLRWKLRNSVENCAGYSKEMNVVYIVSDLTKEIGYFPYYSVQDLIGKGKDYLGDNLEMNDRDKLRYGVSGY